MHTISFATALFFILIITYNRVINLLYGIQSCIWLIDALHIIIVTYWPTISLLHCALICLKSDICSINNNYLLTNSTNTIGIYGQSIQILKNKIDTNYNTNDIELFDEILSAVYSNLRLNAFPRFEK
eukprot:449274_1